MILKTNSIVTETDHKPCTAVRSHTAQHDDNYQHALLVVATELMLSFLITVIISLWTMTTVRNGRPFLVRPLALHFLHFSGSIVRRRQSVMYQMHAMPTLGIYQKMVGKTQGEFF